MREVESRVSMLALSTCGMSVGAKCQMSILALTHVRQPQVTTQATLFPQTNIRRAMYCYI